VRISFFGDIHGNEAALEACLDHLRQLQPDAVYCLGDLVGWLPTGDRTLERMRALGLPTVAGNHDLLVCGLFPDHPEQLDRMQATAYNAGRLNSLPGALEYLLNLPLKLEYDDFVVVHHSPFHLPPAGTPPTIASFAYLDETALAGCLKAWATYSKHLIVSGHDHIPGVYELPGGIASPHFSDLRVYRPTGDQPLTLPLDPAARYWVKVGSGGGPYRDGVPAANSALYDSDRGTLTLYRIPYPTGQLRAALAAHRFLCNLPTIRNFINLLPA